MTQPSASPYLQGSIFAQYPLVPDHGVQPANFTPALTLTGYHQVRPPPAPPPDDVTKWMWMGVGDDNCNT